MRRVGFSAAPADAPAEVLKVADYVACAGGGWGAVRELCDLLLKGRGMWQELVVERYELYSYNLCAKLSAPGGYPLDSGPPRCYSGTHANAEHKANQAGSGSGHRDRICCLGGGYPFQAVRFNPA